MTKHQFYECPQPCDKPHCIYCDGGLSFCEVCKCGEGTLPSECPGEPVTEGQQDNIMAGVSDFREGRWVVGRSSNLLNIKSIDTGQERM